MIIKTIRILAAAAVLLLMSPGLSGARQDSTLNFVNADIRAFIDDVSILTGYTFIVDPDVRGVVNVTSQTPLSDEGVFEVFLSVMRVQGYAVIRSTSGAYQIVPEQEGARTGGSGATSGDQIMTSVIRLQHTSAREAQDILRPLTSAQGIVNAIDSGNAVVIVDYATNVQRARSVLANLDRDTSVFEMVALENVSAADMARILESSQPSTRSGEEGRRYAVTIVPVASSNSLLLRGDETQIAEMMRLARQIDSVSQSNQDYRVIYLSHTDGESILPILEDVAASLAPTGESATGGAISISHHAPTNSLIINAPADAQRQIEQVVRQLDIRRPQVLVEAIIVEISDTVAEELGVQFLFSGDQDGDAPLVMSRFNRANPDILALTGAIAEVDDGSGDGGNTNLRALALNSLLGATGITAGFGGQDSSGNLFGLVLNAVEQDQNSNVLSTPQLMTLDNEEAYILVGQQIPVTTGEALGANNVNPFRTIERRDVGVRLEVRPQINEGDTIRLAIRQEVSSVAGTVSASSDELITNQREISTTVLADNGEIIVLGGLIEQDRQTTASGVPGLGRLPGVGRLFRSEGESVVQRNLMVFIRPTIIRSEEEMRDVTGRSYGRIRGPRGDERTGVNDLDAIADLLTGSAGASAPQ
ncbi:type II secretion system secretin GspD [Hyphobacterium sp. CCMP332]|uniref:type II secretion system secretin GspD n=1 Tax=Hyphobacterium sp. CCMP332 TaxID=2749086 RepID=UPI0016501FC2|nr:type II secretion system secretin GspD [Hyphobacterium sp. CCMP332]QNL19487.1 type II secretion system secretin GspD [Hyphobacterium sp. CCMP332]